MKSREAEKTRAEHLLMEYFRQYRKSLLLFSVCCLVFVWVFILYSLPLAAVGYAGLLCLTASFLLFLYDYRKFVKKHKQLTGLARHVTVSLADMPEVGGLMERDYQDLVRVLFEDKSHLVSFMDRSRTEMIDYYTLWAHQIKTPIAAMDLLLKEEGGGQREEELSQQLFQIERYVEMVLQYLRMESMSQGLLLKEYDLLDLIRQAVRKYAPVFIHKKISLFLEEMEVRVITDEKWLVFVIEQLLSNSLKYTRQGSVSIYMDPAEKKTLVIEDTGMGIRREDLPRIFEKGFTGYNGRADKRSTGIGLYLCRQITSKLSHGLSIDSQAGKGTRVYLNLYRDELEMH